MNDENKNNGTDNPMREEKDSGSVSAAGWSNLTRRGLLKALVSIPFHLHIIINSLGCKSSIG